MSGCSVNGIEHTKGCRLGTKACVAQPADGIVEAVMGAYSVPRREEA